MSFMIFKVIDIFFNVYMLMLFVRILGSWVPEIQQYRFMQFISFYTDPYLNMFRKIIPPIGFLDISPIIAFLGLSVIEQTLIFIIRKIIYIAG